MVMKLYKNIRQDLADILYMWSAQSSLPSITLLKVLDLLQRCDITFEMDNKSSTRINLSLLMAFLYSINLSGINGRSNSEG